MSRFLVEVRGIVQGVGFRPCVHRLVKKFGLAGWVRNTSSGAELELEGESGSIERFASELRDSPPPLALIESIELTELEGEKKYSGFEIIPSARGEAMQTLVSPDMGICPDCLRELFDKNDRRYRYPFINCTNCGPRFTIIKSVPYDRATTSMSEFPMCPDCDREFHDIENRRYHAQPDCCPVCGPEVFFLDAEGKPRGGDAIELARDCIRRGGIVCVKGLGGMHLACLPKGETAKLLRRRKQRDEKPFAVMCRSVEAAEKMCFISEDERRELENPRRPIVLLEKRVKGSFPELSENNYIGVMLPYTPLHYLLMGEDLDCLIMTSANLSETPIMYKNDEALEKLSGIADGFLLHNRDIQTRCDDSLIRVYEGKPYPLRRSRGFVPYPVSLPIKTQLLACGAEQKASFCFSKEGHAFPSQHIGDLKNIESLENYEAQIDHFAALFDIHPAALACDMHPDYMSTNYAEERSAKDGIPLIKVQHHHAHMASCMADNGLDGECLALVWDGTGFGSDGTTWGGELLAGGYREFERLGSIRPIPLPGGDKAVKELWRIGASLLSESGIEQEDTLVKELLRRRLNCPLSSGMGRLFDGISAICGIKSVCSYEGQGAVLLEAAAEDCEGAYEVSFSTENGMYVFDWRPMIRQIASEISGGVSPGIIASEFMNTLTDMAVEQSRYAWSRTGLRRICLTGGVFQNAYLLRRLPRKLRDAGFEVYTHSRVSANDEGLSLGQLMTAEARYVSGGTT